MLTASIGRRGALHGVGQIVRFNWPRYAAAAVIFLVVPLALDAPRVGETTRRLASAVLALPVFWAAASLAVSWLVYDRSPLMSGNWIPDALGASPSRWLTLHAGFDEWTPAARRALGSAGRSLDLFDPARMTEPSIARARRATPEPSPRADFRRLPVAAASMDAVFLPLAAHEWRTHSDRCALMREAARVLAPGGQVVVVEHLRDAANFAAFGPGFLHFHSRRTWLRCFQDSRLAVAREFAITPFVRVFILRRQS